MATKKQIEANRRNAQKSTGPKTPAGKARSSRNAFIHGLSTQRPTVTIENSAEFNAFANKFMDQYEPLEPSEIFLVRRIACMAWRIQRAQCYETLVLDNLCCSIPEDDTRSDQDFFSQLLLDDFRNHQTLAKLQRYETQLERCILRCMKELRDSRKARDANYTDVAYYLRDGEPRGDYKDFVIPYGEGELNSASVAEASSFSINSGGIVQAELGRGEFVTPQPPQADSTSNPVDPVNPVKNNDSSSPSVPSVAKNKDLPNEANSIDGLTNPDLPWIPAENKIYKTENQRIRNNPNKQKWNYDYTPDWYIRVLDAVHFSPKKRKTMTHTDLEKNAGSILNTFKNPEQFLLDIHAITLKQKPINPQSASVAEASSFSINSGGIGQAELGRGEFVTPQSPQADSTSNPVNPVKNNNPSSPSVSSETKNIVSPNEPISDRRACVEQQNLVPSRGTNVVVDHYELCEV